MPHIDYFFVTLSPWTYLAGSRLEEIAARHGATITYKPVDMGRVFAATGGLPLGQRSEARKAYRLQELPRTAKKTGLPLTLHPAHFPTNPAPSSYAIIAAQKAGGGDIGALVRYLLAACWAEEKNIAEDDVIRACLSRAGFDPALADKGLLDGAMAYEANTDEAITRGAFGAPFYITDTDERFWGQDRLEDLDAYLAGAL
ncbi:MAG TPA: 2-hydroxychromene-2-carboxylate isomerase [Rhodobacteraceae bacterium]|jgi:2-hydroxychromene-2-carboxylate isomerase|nr:2-hydroxychromene-2-carboxylate isomerase [Paracoccaceae bacterium]HBV54374.1 2-hydroxychromene-2-carboxylate isomerase [Paracoccaceae bacterium]